MRRKNGECGRSLRRSRSPGRRDRERHNMTAVAHACFTRGRRWSVTPPAAVGEASSSRERRPDECQRDTGAARESIASLTVHRPSPESTRRRDLLDEGLGKRARGESSNLNARRAMSHSSATSPGPNRTRLVPQDRKLQHSFTAVLDPGCEPLHEVSGAACPTAPTAIGRRREWLEDRTKAREGPVGPPIMRLYPSRAPRCAAGAALSATGVSARLPALDSVFVLPPRLLCRRAEPRTDRNGSSVPARLPGPDPDGARRLELPYGSSSDDGDWRPLWRRGSGVGLRRRPPPHAAARQGVAFLVPCARGHHRDLIA